jgi:hypothetical protein
MPPAHPIERPNEDTWKADFCFVLFWPPTALTGSPDPIEIVLENEYQLIFV